MVKIVFKIIKIVLSVIIIGFALFVGMQRFSNNNFSIFGYRIFTVVTESMKPKYNVGDVLITKEVDFSTLNVGDDISYLGKNGSFRDKVVTHRIIKIDNTDSEIKFYTKGIANLGVDPVVLKEQIYGKVVTKLKLVSVIYKFISKPFGFFVCIVIPIFFFIGSEIILSLLERHEKKMG